MTFSITVSKIVDIENKQSKKTMLANNYTGLVLWDAKTGCRFEVEDRGIFEVLDTFPNWVHFQCLTTGERFYATYDRLKSLGAQYKQF